MTPTISNLKTFIGAKEFEVSREFYLAIGWKLNWEQQAIAELEYDCAQFYLQRYYQVDWCNNMMLHATVDSAQDWYERITKALAQQAYGDARVKPPQEQSYGALVTFMWDPSGVLWHLAQAINS